jgi:hypothetical protein
MSQEASKDNEISQDFEELVKNKDESPINKSESDASLSANSPDVDDDNEQKIQQQQQMQQKMFQEQQMQQKMQQKMFQEQQMQQKMFQEQQKMQSRVQPKMVNKRSDSDSDDDDSDEKSIELKKDNLKRENIKKVEEKSKTVENFSNARSLNKTLSLLGVLFALFFVFSSSQLEGALGSISYIANLPFASQVNLVIRGLLFVLVYFLLDYFVL